jgi:hypothetical protein
MLPDRAAERQPHDLAVIHAVFSSILEEIIGEPVPGPPAAPSLEERTSLLRRAVAVLDLAISPLMLRTALETPALKPAADALLRYFVHKRSLRDLDRDKADLVVTFLYRIWKPVPADHDDPNGDDSVMFEKQIVSVLGAPVPPLSLEHEHLLREFELFRSEVHGFRHFDEITDSGIVHRVRTMKECFGAAFYHPHVLAVAAAYNVFFRECFDERFRKAAAEIRQFAASVLRDSAGLVDPGPSRTAIKDFSEGEEAKILGREYGRAQEEFRKISYLRKSVGKQRLGPLRTSSEGAQDGQEEEKIRKMQEMVRVYLQAAGDRASFTVPLPFGSFRLTSAELTAFRRDYGHERSFRADFAGVVMRAVALRVRMTAELLEYSANRGAAYRWKPHADSLTYLLKCSEKLLQQSSALLSRIEQRGLSNKQEVLGESLEALRSHMREVARTLKEVS